MEQKDGRAACPGPHSTPLVGVPGVPGMPWQVWLCRDGCWEGWRCSQLYLPWALAALVPSPCCHHVTQPSLIPLQGLPHGCRAGIGEDVGRRTPQRDLWCIFVLQRLSEDQHPGGAEPCARSDLQLFPISPSVSSSAQCHRDGDEPRPPSLRLHCHLFPGSSLCVGNKAGP